MNKYLFRVEKYNSDKSELLINNAIIAANNNTKTTCSFKFKEPSKRF